MYRLNEKAVLFAPPETIEPEALKQIENTASMPFIFKHVAVMPDCHYGKGATVGTVLATKGAIIPAAVGVDIGCGMIAVKTPLTRDDIADPAAVRTGIERRIPMSAGNNNRSLSESAARRVEELESLATRDYSAIDRELEAAARHAGRRQSLHRNRDRRIEHGVGDAALRLARDRQQDRQPPHPPRADDRQDAGRCACPIETLRISTKGTAEFDEYMRDVLWAQNFARLNRDEMMDRVMIELSRSVYGDASHVRRPRGAAHQLPPQLHAARRALRRTDLGDAQRARSRHAAACGR